MISALMFTGELSFSCLIREICACLMGVGITSTVNGVGCVEAPGFPPADVVFTAWEDAVGFCTWWDLVVTGPGIRFIGFQV